MVGSDFQAHSCCTQTDSIHDEVLNYRPTHHISLGLSMYTPKNCRNSQLTSSGPFVQAIRYAPSLQEARVPARFRTSPPDEHAHTCRL